MKVAIALGLPAVSQALTAVVSAFGHAVVPTDDADLVITDELAKLLAHLKKGKQVIQFICDPRGAVASGLSTSPEFEGRFRMYQVVSWIPDVPVAEDMFAYLQTLPKEGQ